MKPITYLEPETVDEACEQLDRHGNDAVVLAGGQSLLQILKRRLVQADYVVDITAIDDLHELGESDGSFRIGAAVPYVDIVQHPVVRSQIPGLAEAIETIGDHQIRCRGTFVGGIAHADPQGDPPIIATALDAEFHIASVDGTRTVSASEFYAGLFETDLNQGELITHVEVPLSEDNEISTYQSFTRRMGDYAIAAVALSTSLSNDETMTDPRVVVGAATHGPTRLSSVEDSLEDSVITDDIIDEAAETARENVDATDDEVATAAYKSHLVGELTRDALESVR
ncbi:xanthine dehydrogenase family protein subunit M [Natrialba sp. INN-245]|uniref:FAD binding domain-containing protein n=1 Tax=Natrialba sp. INN-245 TaxID=2690967 RepID=UPI0013108309|nr:xanthine dehydrogenase family protein subunit M [Natrialba sp. INN-245]MWV38507.1 hypothetical protein [Natrialba sp. INN-245]